MAPPSTFRFSAGLMALFLLVPALILGGTFALAEGARTGALIFRFAGASVGACVAIGAAIAWASARARRARAASISSASASAPASASESASRRTTG